jgi:hypothetical protein
MVSIIKSLMLTVALVMVSIGHTAAGHCEPLDEDELPFSSIRFFFELNDTDGDLGVQLSLGPSKPWKKLTIEYPCGRRMLTTRTRGSMSVHGMSDLFFESAEPSLEEVSKEEILRRFPEGVYEFEAITIDGEEMEGCAYLSHDFPDPPTITHPVGTDDDRREIDAGNDGLTVTWDPVTNIPLDSYQVIVTNEDALEIFAYDVRVPPSQLSLDVPAGFFAAGTDYEVEVIARAQPENGNQVISITFFTTPE